MIWVTGAGGSVGGALLPLLEDAVGTDKEVDVTDRHAVESFAKTINPDLIVHLAGAKHAPEGEVDPAETVRVNVTGTENILSLGVRTVLASTCKAADPETVYGASKLIAERMVLNAGGVVARFYNVVETQGNVFETWRETDGPLPVMPCWRYFIHLDTAVQLILDVLDLPSGRYTVDPGPLVFIPELAGRVHPGRELRWVPPRRGDRIREPLHAQSETAEDFGRVVRLVGVHDPHREAVSVGVDDGWMV